MAAPTESGRIIQFPRQPSSEATLAPSLEPSIQVAVRQPRISGNVIFFPGVSPDVAASGEHSVQLLPPETSPLEWGRDDQLLTAITDTLAYNLVDDSGRQYGITTFSPEIPPTSRIESPWQNWYPEGTQLEAFVNVMPHAVLLSVKTVPADPDYEVNFHRWKDGEVDQLTVGHNPKLAKDFPDKTRQEISMVRFLSAIWAVRGEATTYKNPSSEDLTKTPA